MLQKKCQIFCKVFFVPLVSAGADLVPEVFRYTQQPVRLGGDFHLLLSVYHAPGTVEPVLRQDCTHNGRGAMRLAISPMSRCSHKWGT